MILSLRTIGRQCTHNAQELADKAKNKTNSVTSDRPTIEELKDEETLNSPRQNHFWNIDIPYELFLQVERIITVPLLISFFV